MPRHFVIAAVLKVFVMKIHLNPLLHGLTMDIITVSTKNQLPWFMELLKIMALLMATSVRLFVWLGYWQ